MPTFFALCFPLPGAFGNLRCLDLELKKEKKEQRMRDLPCFEPGFTAFVPSLERHDVWCSSRRYRRYRTHVFVFVPPGRVRHSSAERGKKNVVRMRPRPVVVLGAYRLPYTELQVTEVSPPTPTLASDARHEKAAVLCSHAIYPIVSVGHIGGGGRGWETVTGANGCAESTVS